MARGLRIPAASRLFCDRIARATADFVVAAFPAARNVREFNVSLLGFLADVSSVFALTRPRSIFKTAANADIAGRDVASRS